MPDSVFFLECIWLQMYAWNAIKKRKHWFAGRQKRWMRKHPIHIWFHLFSSYNKISNCIFDLGYDRMIIFHTRYKQTKPTRIKKNKQTIFQIRHHKNSEIKNEIIETSNNLKLVMFNTKYRRKTHVDKLHFRLIIHHWNLYWK